MCAGQAASFSTLVTEGVTRAKGSKIPLPYFAFSSPLPFLCPLSLSESSSENNSVLLLANIWTLAGVRVDNWSRSWGRVKLRLLRWSQHGRLLGPYKIRAAYFCPASLTPSLPLVPLSLFQALGRNLKHQNSHWKNSPPNSHSRNISLQDGNQTIHFPVLDPSFLIFHREG